MLLSRHSVALVLSVIASASGMPPAGPVVDQALFSRANTTAPKVFGILLFKGFTPLDIFGPIEALQAVARRETLKLYLLSDTLDPVTTEPAINTANSSFFPLIVPTHTFANAPQLDVLLVPGGAGMRAPAAELKPHTDYIAKVFATVPYFLTVCTGSGLAARAGVLDGRYATTNKIAFNQMRTFGPNVKWVAPARWVIDGHVWTSSGVSAGIDMTNQFIKHFWGEKRAGEVMDGMEYVAHPQDFDPFSAQQNLTADYHLPIPTRA